MVEMLIGSTAAFIAVYFFAILLDAPKRSLWYAAWTGGVGWFINLFSLHYFEKGVATFFAGIAIALLSQVFARRLKTPTTIYFLPGFIPIVPGEGVYRAVFAFIEGDYGTAQMQLNEAMLVSGAIAMSIFIVDSIFSLQARLATLSRAKQQEEPIE
ncbi:threonine/serine exporter family protein [Jeotgalibaca caeni]|uniref:threonine/serine exporter family protein n=1 Tax=Jeotgalibaca caeni TaxID=3028623 RepID=UPI00237E36AC|nr:threonine/serine exporter family protein [Jeotgalibaca caeni]MDE1548981.1 threonine/serine exporter family protein [Jeotgalibaca caeni]